MGIQVEMSFAVIATVVAGLAIAGLCAAALPRLDRTTQIGVAGTGVAYLLWTGGSLGLLGRLQPAVFWFGFRPVILILASVAALASPGVRRSLAEWLDVLLDGTIITAGMFSSVWFLVHVQPWVDLQPALSWMTLWLAFQFLITVPAAGLLRRVTPGHRFGPTLTFWVSCLVLAGDMLALLSGRPALGIPFWLASGLLTGSAILVAGARFYDGAFDDPNRPRQIRWWQLPLLPVALYAIWRDQIDPVVVALAVLVFICMCIHLNASSGRNEQLWDSLSTWTRLYRNTLRDSQDAIIMLDDRYQIEYANAAAQAVLGVRPEDLLGRRLGDWTDPSFVEPIQTRIRAFDFSGGGQLRFESPWLGDDGEQRMIEWAMSERAEQPGWALSGRDFSERNHLQRDLLTAARTDSLTGLLNRAALLTETADRLADGEPVVLMVIDLDQFKLVNDTIGHAAGDIMLQRAGEWLRQAAAPGDLLARLGGDEFALLSGTGDAATAMAAAQLVVDAFAGFDPDPAGRPAVTVSIGVVTAAAGRAEDLLRDADLAMYRAKQSGGACAVRFEPWMSQRVLERSRLITELESAIQHGGLLLHLQPVVGLPDAGWIGFEALVRWPAGGRLRPPDEFLPLAQESGLIVPMGTWVMNEALRQLASWPDRTFGVAVNVAAQQLAAPGFGAVVLAALRDNGIEPSRLTLEITEQTAIQDLARTASRLDDLRAEGVRVAIDDFGTGYSSMQYLARLPVDTLKIDRRFIWGLEEYGEHDVLVRSMIRLAGEMGFDVVAEGVETDVQRDLLISYGCRFAQGYLFSRPRQLAELLSATANARDLPARSDRSLGHLIDPIRT